MAKHEKKAHPAPKAKDPSLQIFARGDYVRAREMLAKKANDPEGSEGARAEARQLIEATRLEKGTLLVGLGCIALFLLVVVVTTFTQPH